jgi:PHD-like zinc-binding domain
LCAADVPREPLLPTDSGRQAHLICAEYVPETYVTTRDDGTLVVTGIDTITKDRWNLKCVYCGSKKGAKFQCSIPQCVRAYHATCAAAAGVLVETVDDELGRASSYQCRFHRPKRILYSQLENDTETLEFAASLMPGDSVQGKLPGQETHVPFAGVVVENCQSERVVIIELANGYSPLSQC